MMVLPRLFRYGVDVLDITVRDLLHMQSGLGQSYLARTLHTCARTLCVGGVGVWVWMWMWVRACVCVCCSVAVCARLCVVVWLCGCVCVGECRCGCLCAQQCVG